MREHDEVDVEVDVAVEVDDQWGWCRSCQCLFSFAAMDNPWSCPAGGRHNRNAAGDAPQRRCGSIRLTKVRSAAERDATLSNGAAVIGGPQPVAHWPLTDHFDDVISSSRRSVPRDLDRIEIVESPEVALRCSGGAIEVTDPDFGVATGDMTLSWWMRAQTEQPQNAMLFDHRDGIDGISARERARAGFAVFVNSGRLGVQLADGTTAQNYVDDAADVVGDVPTWVMATITVGAELTVYVNGAQVAVFDARALGERSGASRDAGSVSMFIGRHRNVGGPAYRGLLADVRVYNQVLAPADVAALHSATSARSETPPEAFGWLRCEACGLLVFREVGMPVPSQCHARGGGAHAVDAHVSHTIAEAATGTTADQLVGWTRCGDCAGLFFAPFARQSSCNAGGQHVSDGSSFTLDVAAHPDFTSVDQRSGADSVLFLGANKKGHTILELQDEKRYLEEAVDGEPLDVWGILNARRDTILGAIHDNGPRYVQFSAHGTDDIESGGLWLADEDTPVTAEELASIFAEANAGRLVGGVEVVILNACQSAERGKIIGQHVPYVIAVERDIPDQAAIFFTPMFYERIAAGASIEDALDGARDELVHDGHFDPAEVPMFVSTPNSPIGDTT